MAVDQRLAYLAKQAARAWHSSGDDRAGAEARSAASDLLVAAQRDGDQRTADDVRTAQSFLGRYDTANLAEDIFEEIETRLHRLAQA